MLPEQLAPNVNDLLATNESSARFGLVLTQADAGMLLRRREEALAASGRVEFSGGVLPRLVHTFCDSAYIPPAEYADILARLQDAFYHLKTESNERLDDDTLLHCMKTAFENQCGGSVEYTTDLLMEGLVVPLRRGDRPSLPFPL